MNKSCVQSGRLETPGPQSPGTKFRVSTVPRHLFAGATSDVSIWCLPEELLVYLLKGLHIKDLLNMRSVHPALRDIIDTNSTVWQSASFDDTWPSVYNIKHFERAAKYRNIESLLKLAIAYLYNEGLPHDEEGQRMRTNGMLAAAMFCEVETLTPKVTPFTWLFIRPPWSAGRACCKECVFKNMLLYVKKHQDPQVAMCVSQILKLFEDKESQTRMLRYLTLAVRAGNKSAMFLLWSEKNKNMDKNQTATELHCVRELRDIASLGELEAQLALCRYYSNIQYSESQYIQHYGVSRQSAVTTVRNFFQSATPSNAHHIFTYHPDIISNTMRYILIDWLVEVAGMKEFSTHTLHVAVSVVDRFLRQHKMTRNKLQLLGVAAMVLCSRFLGKDIITIREAAWLTDNTYKYEDVVRMMGEVVATLRGKIRVVTSLDYLYILEELVQVDDRCKYMAEYACEMSLLHAELSSYKRSQIAASCLLLSRLLLKQHYPWSQPLEEFTGFTVSSLTKCLLHIYNKCFVNGKVKDHRDVELEAVRQRYSNEDFCSVSQIKLLSLEEVCGLLGVSGYVFVDDDIQVRYKQPPLPQRLQIQPQNPRIQPQQQVQPHQPRFQSELIPRTVDPGVCGVYSVPSQKHVNTNHACTSSIVSANPTNNIAVKVAGSNAVRIENKVGYQANCTDVTDLNANYYNFINANYPDVKSGGQGDVPMVTSADVTSEMMTSAEETGLQMFRRPVMTSRDTLMTSFSQDNTDISNGSAISRELRTPRKLRPSLLHDHSGRHNIPCLPMLDDQEPMQESPTKQQHTLSPMKTD